MLKCKTKRLTQNSGPSHTSLTGADQLLKLLPCSGRREDIPPESEPGSRTDPQTETPEHRIL